MCQFFSAIITKNGIIFNSATDSHEDLLEQAGIKDDSSSPDFVRVELLPKDHDIFNHQLDNWELKVDQDIIPAWFNKESTESKAKEAIQQVWGEIFFIDLQDKWQLVKNKSRIFVKNSKIIGYGNCQIEGYGNCQIKGYDNCQIKGSGNCQIKGSDNCQIEGYDNCQIEGYDNCQIKGYGNCQILKLSIGVKIEIFRNSVMSDIPNKKIWISEESDFVVEKFRKD